jgi:seryl-tRNA synthetase
MNLYELTTEYTALLAEYEAAEDDERRGELLDMIDALQDDIGDKGEAYARVLRNLTAQHDALEAEAKRLTDKADAVEAAQKRLKAQLLSAMQRVGATKLQTSIGAWSVRINQPSVDVLDANKVPAEYHVPQDDKIDKRAILKNFKETGEIVGGVSIYRTTSIQFR